MQNLIFYSKLLFFLLVTACGSNNLREDNAKPAANRFTKVVLTQGMDEPMTMDFLPDNQIIIIERKGGVKIFDEKNQTMTVIATLPVNRKYINKAGRVREAEEGLMGVVVDPDFIKNNWIYFYYADSDEPKHILARYTLKNNALLAASKKIVIEVPTQREECCHTGGGMQFDKEGNLYLSIGNNTVNPRSGASNLDERPGHKNEDDQRGPANSNDLRGKIIKIYPEDDGSYSIPKGNLFPIGMKNTRPEIFTMGHRNPWRISIDSKTGYLYWGEVGPDANKDSIWGPKGYDEFNQAKGPGFFGWPYFIGNNQPYNHLVDFEGKKRIYGAAFDPTHPVNNSINNTGIKELPLPVPALIYYPYGPSDKFPLVGSAGRSATGGPVYRQTDFENAPRPFPSYYEGKWFIIDFMRDWIMSVSLDENGTYQEMERFLPEENFSAGIDMDFGPSGDLYILEYGDSWFKKNLNSKLIKIEYQGGNRKPRVQASANKLSGAIPFTSQFTSQGTFDFDDYDLNHLTYQWEITNDDGAVQYFKNAHPSVRFDKEGIYQVSLTVTDSYNKSNTASFEIVAGNEPPKVTIDLMGSNRSFYFGNKPLNYLIEITDHEDGIITDHSQAAITFDYVPAGFDPIEVVSSQRGSELLAKDAISKNLIESNDCYSCHQFKVKSIGPSFTEVAQKYQKTDEYRTQLINSIINGQSGIWGEHAMAAHPQLSKANAGRMVDYILTSLDDKPTLESLPIKGTLQPILPEEDDEGVFLLRAAYQDKGANELKSLFDDAIITLSSPILFPPFDNENENTRYLTTPRSNFYVLGKRAHIGLKNIDLSGIKQVKIFVQTPSRVAAHGGRVEMRLDDPDGKIIAMSNQIEQRDVPREGWGQNNAQRSREEKIIARRKNKQVLSLNFEGIHSTHDIYFVFKNSNSKNDEIMMSINEMEFYEDVKPVN